MMLHFSLVFHASFRKVSRNLIVDFRHVCGCGYKTPQYTQTLRALLPLCFWIFSDANIRFSMCQISSPLARRASFALRANACEKRPPNNHLYDSWKFPSYSLFANYHKLSSNTGCHSQNDAWDLRLVFTPIGCAYNWFSHTLSHCPAYNIASV